MKPIDGIYLLPAMVVANILLSFSPSIISSNSPQFISTLSIK